MEEEEETLAGPSNAIGGNPEFPLHRVRFVDWQPSSVTAIATLPLLNESQRSLVAIGKENGNIDICKWSESDTGIGKNGTIAKGWTVDSTIIGSNPSKVESLAFILSPTKPNPTPRLFSTSGGSILTEHFLPVHLLQLFNAQSSRSASTPSRSIQSQGGTIWSMAASPRGKHLAIGCEDGIVRIVDIENERFELQSQSKSMRRGANGLIEGTASSLDRTKTRIVSLAWGPPKRVKKEQKERTEESSDEDEEDQDEWQDSFIVGGTIHSHALVWSVKTGKVLQKLLVDKARKEQTFVWSVATLPDGSCVLGDSLGHVTFFDANTFTVSPNGRHASHDANADVLCLCVGADGKSLYSASVDRKVVEYARLGNGKQAKWISTGKRRLHSHDVRAIAMDPPYNHFVKPANQRRLPILISGGVDFILAFTPASSPCEYTILDVKKDKQVVVRSKKQAFDHVNPLSTTAVTTFADTIHRKGSFVPQTARESSLGGGKVVQVCSSNRWILAKRETSIAIWKLATNASDKESFPQELESNSQPWKKLLEMQIKCQSNLTLSMLSSDGRYLLISDLFESKLFELQQDENDRIEPKKLKSFSIPFGATTAPSCSAARFTNDCKRLILASYPGSNLHVIELTGRDCRLVKTFSEHRQLATLNRSMAGRMAKKGNGRAINGRKKGKESRSSINSSSSEGEDEEESAVTSHKQSRTLHSRIDLIEISPDGQYLISIDTSRRIHCFSLDTMRHHGVLPSPSNVPTSLAFNPIHPTQFICAFSTNEVLAYDAESRQMLGRKGANSNDDLCNATRALNRRLALIRDNVIGVFWIRPNLVVAWGATFLCTAMRQDKKSSTSGNASNGIVNGNQKRRHSDDERDQHDVDSEKDVETILQHWKTHQTSKYQSILYAGVLYNESSNPEMLVIERPYYEVTRNLPPAWYSGSKYGQ